MAPRSGASGDLIGTTVTDLGFDDVAERVAIKPGGDILLAGSTLGAKLDHDFLLLRYDAHGVLDCTFGDHGVVKTDFGHGDDFARASSSTRRAGSSRPATRWRRAATSSRCFVPSPDT